MGVQLTLIGPVVLRVSINLHPNTSDVSRILRARRRTRGRLGLPADWVVGGAAAGGRLGGAQLGLRDGLVHPIGQSLGDITHKGGLFPRKVGLGGETTCGAQNRIGPNDGVALHATLQVALQRADLGQHVSPLQLVGGGRKQVVWHLSVLLRLGGGGAPDRVGEESGSFGDDL
jgi:hypothetical protein